MESDLVIILAEIRQMREEQRQLSQAFFSVLELVRNSSDEDLIKQVTDVAEQYVRAVGRPVRH